MKQFLVFLLLAVVLLCCGCRQESSMKDWGEQVKENQSIPDTDAVASVNGVPISKERYENYKVGLQNAQGKFTDEQVLDKMIRREVLYQEIERLGITVEEDEVRAFNEERFALIDDDPVTYQIFKDYADGLGITLEEYKEMSMEVSRDSLLTTKYQEHLMAQYEKEKSEFLFDAYYEQNLDRLVEKAAIEIYE